MLRIQNRKRKKRNGKIMNRLEAMKNIVYFYFFHFKKFGDRRVKLDSYCLLFMTFL